MPKKLLPKLTDIDALKGRYVFLRASLNVPIENGVVRNQFRLMRGMATLNYLTHAGARVILAGHISNDKKTEKSETLLPVYEVLKEHSSITFCEEVTTTLTKNKRDSLQDGEVLLIENLRHDPREKKNDANFARELADLADLYVNDSFAVSHREHASVVGITKYIKGYAGLNFVHEVEELEKARKPESPSLFLIGGAKFETKIPLISEYLDTYDNIFVGGALAHDFFKAKGFEIGKSRFSDTDMKKSSLLDNKKILLPIDVTVMGPKGIRVTTPDNVEKDENILDSGPATTDMLSKYINEAKTILWNGPLGDYKKGFDKGTVACAKSVADAAGYSIVGGGDTIAAIESLNCQEKFGFLSTAGGAMLVFLEKGTLPGIEALKHSKKK